MGYPSTWNRYTYVVGNPINLVDPDGARLRRTSGPASPRTQRFYQELNPSLTAQAGIGTGRIGVNATLELLPRFGYVTYRAGAGIGIGASVTANVSTAPPLDNPKVELASNGGAGLVGARVRYSDSASGDRALLVGVGPGVGWAGTATTPFAQGYLFNRVPGSYWTYVSTTGENGEFIGGEFLWWRPDATSDFSAITGDPHLRTLSPDMQSIYDLFNSGLACIDGICMY